VFQVVASVVVDNENFFVERQEERLKTNNRDLSMASVVFSCAVEID